MAENQIPVFYPETLQQWRNWLVEHHQKHKNVWVVFYTKSSENPSISWSEAVDEALCFGWIDSKKIKITEEKSHHYFSKRKVNGTWSKINKDKIEKLVAENRMTQTGLECIAIAKENGSWNLLDSVEDLLLPKDLEVAFKAQPKALEFYQSLSKSNKKNILLWLVLAKQSETREKRISEIIASAMEHLKPKHQR